MFWLGVKETAHVRQICPEQIWTAAGWPREAGFGPWMGQTILVSQPNRDSVRGGLFALTGTQRRTTSFGTSRASPFSPSAAPMFASASCLRGRQFGLELVGQPRAGPAQRGLAHGWAKQSQASPRKPASRSMAAFDPAGNEPRNSTFPALRPSWTRDPRPHPSHFSPRNPAQDPAPPLLPFRNKVTFTPLPRRKP